MSLKLLKNTKFGIKIESRGVSEASRGVLWRLIASRGISSCRLVASRGVSWRHGANHSFAGGVEGVHPTCKGESTMETPPYVSYCLRCVRSYAVCRVPCVIVCCALCVV